MNWPYIIGMALVGLTFYAIAYVSAVRESRERQQRKRKRAEHITTVKELWNGYWWLWTLHDGRPISFVRQHAHEEDQKRQRA